MTHAACSPDDHGHCSACGDEALPMRVLAVGNDATATVVGADAQITVATDLIVDVAVGDTLLVHQGFAIARLEGRPT
jgi:hydrogenase maturation factor